MWATACQGGNRECRQFIPLAVNLNLFWGQGWSPGVQFTAGRGAGVNHLPAVPLLPLQDCFLCAKHQIILNLPDFFPSSASTYKASHTSGL